MVLGVVEKTFLGYGLVIVGGALAFVGARFKVYYSRDEALAARERIYKTINESHDYVETYPHYTDEAKKKFYLELENKKKVAVNQ